MGQPSSQLGPARAVLGGATGPPGVSPWSRLGAPARRARRRAPGALVLGAGISITAIALFPVAWMVLGSVRPVEDVLAYPPTWQPDHLSLRWYQAILTTPMYMQWLANSYAVAIGTTALSLTLGSLAAYGFSRYRVPGGRALLIWMLALRLMPAVSLVLPYFKIATGLHLYDTRLGLILAYASFVLPLTIWLLKSYMDNIPVELEEAAMVDGAHRLGAMWHILVPLIAPGLVATGTMGFLAAWNEFFFAVVLTNSPQSQTLTVGLGRFFGEYGRDWNGIMSLTTFASLPLLAAFVALQRWVVQGMTAGAVK